jgi:hypothetical protein
MGWPVGVSVPVLWSTLNCTTVSEFWFAWPSDAPLGKWPCSGRRAELAPPNALGSENSFQDPDNDYFCKLDFRQLATYVLALEVPPMPFRSAHRVRATCIKAPKSPRLCQPGHNAK